MLSKEKNLHFIVQGCMIKYIDFSPQNLSIYPPNGSEKSRVHPPALFCIWIPCPASVLRGGRNTKKSPASSRGYRHANFLKLQADRADGAGAGARAAFNAFGGVDSAFAVLFGNGAYGAS